MNGSRLGSRGRVYGSVLGSAGDDEGSGGPISRDAGSSIYVPANATEWDNWRTLTGLGGVVATPSGLWLCQEGSGNLADSIGSTTLSPVGTGLGYSGAVGGWTRVGFTTTDAGTGGFSSTAAGLPDPATTSCLVLAYMSIGVVAALRSTLKIASVNRVASEITAAGKLQCVSSPNTAAGASAISSAVRPMVLKHNITGLTDVSYSDQDKVVPVYSGTATTKLLELGGNATRASIAGTYMYAAAWYGAAAEMSDATIKSMLQGLGWTIAWT